MALTANYTTRGFEFVRNLLGFPVTPVLYELTPNTAFSMGDMVILTNNRVAKAAAGATNVLGVINTAFTTTTNPDASLTLGEVLDNPFAIFRCTFSDHRDATATGGSTTTLVDTALSTSADDVWNGALLYIYAGAAAGSFRTVEDYTGSSDTLTFDDPTAVAVDSTSTYILLGAGIAAGENINIGTIGVNLKDENTIDGNATTASEAGPLVITPTPQEEIKNLVLHCLIRKHLYNTV